MDSQRDREPGIELPAGLAELLGGSDGAGGLANMVAQARERLATAGAEGAAGGGLVRVSLAGDGRMTGIRIAAECSSLLEQGELEDLILAAFNAAFDQIQAEKHRRVEALTGIPADTLAT